MASRHTLSSRIELCWRWRHFARHLSSKCGKFTVSAKPSWRSTARHFWRWCCGIAVRAGRRSLNRGPIPATAALRLSVRCGAVPPDGTDRPECVERRHALSVRAAWDMLTRGPATITTFINGLDRRRQWLTRRAEYLPCRHAEGVGRPISRPSSSKRAFAEFYDREHFANARAEISRRVHVSGNALHCGNALLPGRFLQQSDDSIGCAVPSELARACKAPCSHPRAQIVIIGKRDDFCGELGGRVRVAEERSVAARLDQRRLRRDDHRAAAEHCFDGRDTESFVERGQNEAQ